MSKHVVLIHRYFAPDTPPYASILEAIAREVGGAGMRVTVLTCQPSYNKAVVSHAPKHEFLTPSVEIVRFPVLDDRSSSAAKLLNLLWFCLRIVQHFARLGKVDVVMAATTPPVVVAALSSRLAKLKGARFIYHKQDVYPEVTVGLGARMGRVARVVRAIDARTDRRAARVVVLSEDMGVTVMGRGVRSERIEVINNFDPWAMTPGAEVERGEPATEAPLEVVFAGNLGRFQGLQTLFDAIDLLGDEPVRFHFFGRGALSSRVDDLARKYGEARLVAHGYCDPTEVAGFLSAKADLGVVSLAPGVIRAAYPSKTMSYLRQGTPILAMVESDSELARTVASSRIGVQVEPGAVSNLVTCLAGLARDRESLAGAHARARSLYEKEFVPELRLSQWSRLFETVVS